MDEVCVCGGGTNGWLLSLTACSSLPASQFFPGSLLGQGMWVAKGKQWACMGAHAAGLNFLVSTDDRVLLGDSHSTAILGDSLQSLDVVEVIGIAWRSSPSLTEMLCPRASRFWDPPPPPTYTHGVDVPTQP